MGAQWPPCFLGTIFAMFVQMEWNFQSIQFQYKNLYGWYLWTNVEYISFIYTNDMTWPLPSLMALCVVKKKNIVGSQGCNVMIPVDKKIVLLHICTSSLHILHTKPMKTYLYKRHPCIYISWIHWKYNTQGRNKQTAKTRNVFFFIPTTVVRPVKVR